MLLYELISASRWAETVIKPNAGFSFTTELLFIKKIQILEVNFFLCNALKPIQYFYEKI